MAIIAQSQYSPSAQEVVRIAPPYTIIKAGLQFPGIRSPLWLISYQATLVWDVWAIVSDCFHNITNNEVCVSLVVNIVILDG